MTKTITAALLLAALGLSACNTIEGAGQDVKSAGQGIANGASAVKTGN